MPYPASPRNRGMHRKAGVRARMGPVRPIGTDTRDACAAADAGTSMSKAAWKKTFGKLIDDIMLIPTLPRIHQLRDILLSGLSTFCSRATISNKTST